jgi:hypothetical protein
MPRHAVSGSYGKGKLAPLLSLFTADREDDGILLCRQILGNGGSGHTAITCARRPNSPGVTPGRSRT